MCWVFERSMEFKLYGSERSEEYLLEIRRPYYIQEIISEFFDGIFQAFFSESIELGIVLYDQKKLQCSVTLVNLG